MAISTLVVKNAGTIAVTGGTDKTYTAVRSNGNTVELTDLSVTDMRLRPLLSIRFNQPSVSAGAPNGYTQGRCLVVLKQPKLLANGKITVNTVRYDFAFDFETSDVEKQLMIDTIAHTAIIAALKSALKDGAL